MSSTAQYFYDSSGTLWAITVNTDGSLQSTVVSNSGGDAAGVLYASDIVDSVKIDSQFTSQNTSVIVDYINRVCQRILRDTQWCFLRSQPKKFITQVGGTDYWIGNTTIPPGTIQSGLELPDVWNVWTESVWDRTSNRQLMPNSSAVLNSSNIAVPDGTLRPGAPNGFRYEITTPNILSIYPSSDSRPIYQPVPLAPVITFSAGGSLPGRLLYIGATLVDSSGGESVVCAVPTTVYVPANHVLTAASPVAEVASGTQVSYNAWNVYVGTTPTGLELQNGTPIAIGTSFTEANSGSVSGVAPPVTSTITPLNGYVIEFKYYQQRNIITSGADALQIPAIYKDVIVAGVNFYIELFLRQEDGIGRSSIWKQEFLEGIKGFRKDLNLNFRNTDFISPDQTAHNTRGYLSRNWS